MSRQPRMQWELEGMLEELVATLGYDEMIERRGSGGGHGKVERAASSADRQTQTSKVSRR